jgi:CheY-like chemotaxis protein
MPGGEPAEAPMRIPPPPPPLAVLVVDDNRDAADTLGAYLRYAGHSVRTAGSAADAGRALAGGFRPDAVLLDLVLPGTSGYDVAHAVCAAAGRRPLLVAVTGHHGLEGWSAREGFDHHFLKPVNPDDLLAALGTYAARLPDPPVSTDHPGA